MTDCAPFTRIAAKIDGAASWLCGSLLPIYRNLILLYYPPAYYANKLALWTARTEPERPFEQEWAEYRADFQMTAMASAALLGMRGTMYQVQLGAPSTPEFTFGLLTVICCIMSGTSSLSYQWVLGYFSGKGPHHRKWLGTLSTGSSSWTDHELILSVPFASLGWAIIWFVAFMMAYISKISRTTTGVSDDVSLTWPWAIVTVLTAVFVLGGLQLVLSLILLRKLYLSGG